MWKGMVKMLWKVPCAFLLLLLMSHADSTIAKAKYNYAFASIPEHLGLERKLPADFWVGIDLDLNIKAWVANDSGFYFDQKNSGNVYIYRPFSMPIFSLAPVFGIEVSSSEEPDISRLFLGLWIFKKITLLDDVCIVPRIKSFVISPNKNGVTLLAPFEPELMVGIVF